MAIASSGKYIAVERTSSFLAELSKEQGYQRSGAVSDNEIARVGQQFGVELVCVAELSEAFGEKYISARLVSVENAEIMVTANTRSPLSNMDELMKTCQTLGKELSAETLREKAVREESEAKVKQESEEKEALKLKEIEEQWEQGYFVYAGLYFQNKLFKGGAISPVDIINEAKSSRVGGFNNWRLPSTSEIEDAIRGCKKNR